MCIDIHPSFLLVILLRLKLLLPPRSGSPHEITVPSSFRAAKAKLAATMDVTSRSSSATALLSPPRLGVPQVTTEPSPRIAAKAKGEPTISWGFGFENSLGQLASTFTFSIFQSFTSTNWDCTGKLFPPAKKWYQVYQFDQTVGPSDAPNRGIGSPR